MNQAKPHWTRRAFITSTVAGATALSACNPAGTATVSPRSDPDAPMIAMMVRKNRYAVTERLKNVTPHPTGFYLLELNFDR